MKIEEEKLIFMLFYKVKLQKTILPHLNEQYFKNKNIKYIISKLYSYYKKYQQPILKDDFFYLLREDEKIKMINNYLNDYSQKIDKELFLQLLTEDIKSHLLYELKQKINQNIISLDEVGQLTKKIENLNLNYSDDFIDFKDIDTVIKLEKEAKDGSFLTGYPQIDKYVKSNGGFTKGSFTTFIAPPHTGKCVVGKTKILINFFDTIKYINIEDLFTKTFTNQIETLNNKKFIKQAKVNNTYVWSNTGFKKIEYIYQTIPYTVYKITLNDGKILECADIHIVATLQGLKHVKELEEGIDTIHTKELYSLVEKVEKTDKKVVMYDIQLKKEIKKFDKNKFSDLKVGDFLKNNDNNYEFFEVEKIDDKNIYINTNSHLYYTNGMLSHNTLLLTNIAAKAVKNKKKVLYLSFEMPENEIIKRIYVNLFDSKMVTINKELNKIKIIINEIKDDLGDLKTKEYPSSTCTPTMIELLLERLKEEHEIDKNSFFPDILIIDQLTTMGTDIGKSSLYEKGKNGIESLKAIGQKFKIILFSAAQGNRDSGKGKDSLKMDDVAESWGIPQISDVCFGALVDENSINDKTPDYYELNVNCFKNRLTGNLQKSVWGVNKQKMTLVQKTF